jgi:hypothetical protein
MIDIQQEELTAQQIADQIGATVYSVGKAIEALGIQGRRPLNDRRLVLYPAGTANRVKDYLESH